MVNDKEIGVTSESLTRPWFTSEQGAQVSLAPTVVLPQPSGTPTVVILMTTTVGYWQGECPASVSTCGVGHKLREIMSIKLVGEGNYDQFVK